MEWPPHVAKFFWGVGRGGSRWSYLHRDFRITVFSIERLPRQIYHMHVVEKTHLTTCF